MKSKLIAICIILTGCSSYNVTTYTKDDIPTACKNPTYVLTGARQTVTSDGGDLSLHDILKDVQTKYGSNATIQNIRWDMKNRKRVSAIYDVIRCNSE